MAGNTLNVNGPAGSMMEYERNMQEAASIPTHQIELAGKIEELHKKNKIMKGNYEINFSLIKDDQGRIFRSLFRRWEEMSKVKVRFSKYNGKITIENAKKSEIETIEKQIDKFIMWFKDCNLINCNVSKGYPQVLDKNKSGYDEIRVRIDRITNPDKDLFELSSYASGPKATRVSRMELISWILINEFDCTVEGGFVRDWVVGGREAWVPGTKLSKNNFNGKYDFAPELQDKISPKDLDVYLSLNKTFDKERFKRAVTKFGITVEFDEADGWRIYCVFDKDAKSGPFTADLIEPFQQACQDTVDMDVSNLYVKSGFVNELGMRIPLDNVQVSNGPVESITVDMIVQNIQNKVFNVMRPINTAPRIQKLQDRGWKEGPKKYILLPKSKISTFTLKKDDLNYVRASDMMKPLNNITILEILVIGNKPSEKIYQGHREGMEKTGAVNERILFHGTSEEGALGVRENNFDNRYAKDGAWGYGTYFSDDPNKSHSYAPPNKDGVRHMLICRVLLGKENIMNGTKNGLVSPGIGFDSVRGTGFKFTEYIVYRYGQALPFLMVKYRSK